MVERRGGIYWETGGIADGLTKRGFNSYFRIVFTASQNGQLAAVAQEIIAKRLDKQPKDITVMVVHEDSDYGTSVATAAETRPRNSASRSRDVCHTRPRPPISRRWCCA